MKEKISRFIRELNFIRSLNETPKFLKPKWYALNQIDKKLIKYVGKAPGYFVELGANDGITQSNTKHLELFHGWRGVLIEPWPQNFAKLNRVRSTSTVKVNAACVSFGYELKTVRLLFSNLMTTPLALESDIEAPEDHARAGEQFLMGEEKISYFDAPAKTLESVLEQARAPHQMDLLALDVEGAEIEVLKGLDHETFRFKWLLIECRNVPQMAAFLSSKGYVLQDQLTEHDYLFRDELSVPNPV